MTPLSYFMCFLKEKAPPTQVKQLLSNSAEGLYTLPEQQSSYPFIPPRMR